MQLKKPEGINFSKPNPVHPFDDATSLAFWSKKNDASLFAVGMHSKKRPNNLVFARTYNNEVMDMIELGVEMAKSVKESKVRQPYQQTSM
jgi:ribosome production factor 2